MPNPKQNPPQAPVAAPAEPTVAAATGVSANAVTGSGQPGKERAARIQKAMEDAIKQACEEGLRVNEDAPLIKERMMAARQAILDKEAGLSQ